MNSRMLRAMAVLVALVLAIAGCGGGGDDDDGGAAGDAKKVTQAKPSGDVTWCIGKDTTGAFGTVVDNFNKANPDANAKLLQLPEAADLQREQQIQRLQAKSDECDVLGMDVVWTAEYAAQGWITDVTDAVEKRKDEFIPSTLETALYEDKYWAIPFNTNAGFLYYRKDQAPRGADRVGGGLRGRREEERPRLPGLPLRGSDGQLPRAALQRRRPPSSTRTAQRPRPIHRRSVTS